MVITYFKDENMIKKILVCGFLLLFTNTANAITYGAKKTIQISGLAAVVGVASLNVVLNSIETGKDFDKSIKILDIASKTKVTRAVYEGLFSYIILSIVMVQDMIFLSQL